MAMDAEYLKEPEYSYLDYTHCCCELVAADRVSRSGGCLGAKRVPSSGKWLARFSQQQI